MGKVKDIVTELFEDCFQSYNNYKRLAKERGAMDVECRCLFSQWGILSDIIANCGLEDMYDEWVKQCT